MTDKEQHLIEPTESDDDVPESMPKLTRPKRQMSEKQLANLAKAREKAKIALNEKRARNKKLKDQEKKLKELKLKEREDRIQAEMRALQPEKPAAEEVAKPVRKKVKKKPKVIYYSSSEDDDEPEIVYKKRPKKTASVPPTPTPTPMPTHRQIKERDEKLAQDAAVKRKYDQEVQRLRRQYMMEQVFPY